MLNDLAKAMKALDGKKSRERANHRRSGVRQEGRGRRRGEGSRYTEHCIVVKKGFVVLNCFGPAGKGDWVELFLCCSIPLQISLLGAKFSKISCSWTSSELPARKVKVSPVFLVRSISKIGCRLWNTALSAAPRDPRTTLVSTKTTKHRNASQNSYVDTGWVS